MMRWLLRKGEARDLQPLQALLASQQMEADIAPDEFLVAEIDDRLAGAARLEWEDQAAYVRPVLVDAAWRGKGVGKALIRAIARDLPDLYVVSRGEAAGFYRRLGFVPMPWDQVPRRYRQECESCPDLEACCPEPMVLTTHQTCWTTAPG